MGLGSIFDVFLVRLELLDDSGNCLVLLEHFLVVRPAFLVVPSIIELFCHLDKEFVRSTICMLLEFVFVWHQKIGICPVFLFWPFRVLLFSELAMPYSPRHREFWFFFAVAISIFSLFNHSLKNYNLSTGQKIKRSTEAMPEIIKSFFWQL